MKRGTIMYNKLMKFIFLTTILLGTFILPASSVSAANETVIPEATVIPATEEEQSTNSEIIDDSKDVFFDKDVIPGSYDDSIYKSALSTIYLENNSSENTHELTLYVDHEDLADDFTIKTDIKNRMITCTFPNTFNAVGTVKQTFSNSSYVKKISVSTAENNVVVTVSYRANCLPTSENTKHGIILYFSKANFSMCLRLPSGVTKSQITDTDYYYNNMFTIKIPGKWKIFYKNNPITTSTNVIKSWNISQKNNSTILTVKTSKLQGYKYSKKGDFLLLKIDDPRKIYKKIVVLDAGHGGKDSGAISRGVYEKNLNYTIIYKYASEYFNSPASDIKTYWSRYNDTFISLSARARFASQVGADLFISLHMNSASSSKANGMEVYYARSNNRRSSMGLSSQMLAKRMHSQLKQNLTIPSRGVRKAEFYVLRHNTVPSILIELGFISGNKDHKKITSTNYQKKAAKNIFDCVNNTFKAYPTGR